MADVTPASPSLQGIQPELRNKIYDHLSAEPCNVSGRKLLKLREQSRGGDLWEQFQSAILEHPLIATCRQMRTEFGSVLATKARKTYRFIVHNLDWHQLAVFREFAHMYCYLYMYECSEKYYPPLLYHKVVLYLKIDSNILPSIVAYGEAARVQSRSLDFPIYHHSVGIKHMIMPGNSVYGDSTSKSKSVTKAQAELARDALRGLCKAYELYGLYKLHKPEQEAIGFLLDHLNEMVDSHY
ncbi:hypothetical protein MBLNU13_g07307t1 [Cladosporium sp. NU13]